MELDESFIMSGDDIDVNNLFSPVEENKQEDNKESPKVEENKSTTGEQNKEGNKETADGKQEEIDTENLFGSQEGVGSQNNDKSKTNVNQNQGKQDTEPTESGSSPDNSNFYYSIASALVDDGILPDLDDDYIKNIKDSQGFAEAIDKQVNARLDETQKRINAALNAGVQADDIKAYENVLRNLDNISEDNITAEDEQGETLRKQLIYQDFINRGFSKERAIREVNKSVESGNDVDDAKDALESNKTFYKNQYDDLIKSNQEETENYKKKRQEEADALKKQLIEDKEVFNGVQLDASTRRKAYEAITKPVYKTEDGEYLTTLQKYERDNPVDFRKKVSILYTLTDGFKNIDKLVNGQVKKEVRKSLSSLEDKLKNTISHKGNPKFMGIGAEDNNTKSSGWMLDV